LLGLFCFSELYKLVPFFQENRGSAERCYRCDDKRNFQVFLMKRHFVKPKNTNAKIEMNPAPKTLLRNPGSFLVAPVHIGPSQPVPNAEHDRSNTDRKRPHPEHGESEHIFQQAKEFIPL
jgi:hypothetical protein